MSKMNGPLDHGKCGAINQPLVNEAHPADQDNEIKTCHFRHSVRLGGHVSKVVNIMERVFLGWCTETQTIAIKYVFHCYVPQSFD